MNALKAFISIVLVAILAACSASSGPSDADIEKLAQQYMREAASGGVRSTGVELDKIVTITPKIKNKVQNGELWFVEVEMTTKPKIDPASANPQEQIFMKALGVPTKDAEFKQTETIKMQKGSNGWMVIM